MTSAPSSSRRLTPLEPLVERIELLSALDPPAQAIGKRVRGALDRGALKDALSGTWLGHALHPMLTDVVIGSFLSASLLDLLGSGENDGASERLIAVGIAAYGPTALTGVNDWADTEPADDGVRRAGLVHAAVNSAALSLYAASLVARRRGSRRKGADTISVTAMPKWSSPSRPTSALWDRRAIPRCSHSDSPRWLGSG